jgi:hypothetical protein
LKAKIKETRAGEGVNQKYSVSEKIFVSRLPPLRGLPKATGYAGGLLLRKKTACVEDAGHN